jgi:hypothetical protein
MDATVRSPPPLQLPAEVDAPAATGQVLWREFVATGTAWAFKSREVVATSPAIATEKQTVLQHPEKLLQCLQTRLPRRLLSGNFCRHWRRVSFFLKKSAEVVSTEADGAATEAYVAPTSASVLAA